MDSGYIALIVIIVLLLSILVIYLLLRDISSPFHKLSLQDAHCFITGGSSGLGLALADELLKRNAKVTIVARDEQKLKMVYELFIKSYSAERVCVVSADVTNPESMEKAVKEATEKIGSPIVNLFCCAGGSHPGFFLDVPTHVFEDTMKVNYLGTVNTILPVARQMISSDVNGKIVLVSSTLGVMNLIGYSSYSPTKHAIMSLAETLRQEFRRNKIDVHVYAVSTIHTPGYEKEASLFITMLSKPQITKEIEGTESSDASPEARAKTLIKGLEKNHFIITSDFLTDLFRSVAKSNSPGNGFFDFFLGCIGLIAVPVWRISVDHMISKRSLNKDK